MAMKKKHERDEPMTFIIFTNHAKKSDQDSNLPDWVGKLITQDGEILRLAGWERSTNNSENKYIAGKISEFLTKDEVKERQEKDAKRRKEEEEEEGLDDLLF